ncbi:MAG TPA: DUF4230 domain-containing protein [Verrucomicrobiae bacterium]|nr:DUF4230 domain-containing protein [Verrucomicrobiae bacterium]
MWKRIKFYTVSTIIIALGAACLYLYYFGRRGATVHRVVDAPAVLQQIQRLSELVTVKYNIQKVIGLKEEKVPFGSEQILLMVQASVLGGVDLAALDTNDVRITADSAVTVRLPVAKVMHVYIDEQQTKVWDRSKTWWTPWVPLNPELEQKARLAALEAIQTAAVEMGIVRQAQENAEKTVRAFLHATGVESVQFEEPAAPGTPAL